MGRIIPSPNQTAVDSLPMKAVFTDQNAAIDILESFDKL